MGGNQTTSLVSKSLQQKSVLEVNARPHQHCRGEMHATLTQTDLASLEQVRGPESKHTGGIGDSLTLHPQEFKSEACSGAAQINTRKCVCMSLWFLNLSRLTQRPGISSPKKGNKYKVVKL